MGQERKVLGRVWCRLPADAMGGPAAHAALKTGGITDATVDTTVCVGV